MQRQVVKSLVEDSIRSGEFGVGQTLPAVETLAPRWRCTETAMRGALIDLAREGVVRRVQRKGTVVLRRPRNGRVAMILSHDAHLNGLLVEPIHRRLHEAGLDADLTPVSNDPSITAAHLERLFPRAEVADVLLAVEPPHPVNPGGEVWSAFRRFRRRVVFAIAQERFDPEAAWVCVDHQQAARHVADHLLALRHRRVAVSHDSGGGWVATAAWAMRHLMEIRGGRCVTISFAEADLTGVLARMVREEGVTAFWAVNDAVAMRAVQGLTEAGLRVPGDVTVIGRHDTPWALASPVPLTTLSLDAEAVAEAVVRAVRRAVRGDVGLPPLAVVPPRLVVRQSSGQVRAVESNV